MGYDIENIQMPVTQDTTNDILSSDSKNNYYLVDNSTIEPLLTKEEEVKLIKDETSKIFDNSSMKSVKDEVFFYLIYSKVIIVNIYILDP